jgi:proline iminopeptidase
MAYMNTDEHTIKSGMLPVGDGHTLWWQEWGAKSAKIPIVFLHGGPGGNCKDKNKLNFDPTLQRVIFFDQRGSGQSTPFGSIQHNTTQHLVADIHTLLQHLGEEKVMITGGSWGSTLALAYACAFPKTVVKMLLGGIFLGTKKETDYIVQGGLATHYPESWQQFIELVPEEYAHNTAAYYLKKFLSDDADVMEYVRRWCLLEDSALSLDSDYKKVHMNSFEVDERSRTLATIEANYFVNNNFLPDDYLLVNSSALQHIPIVLLQGRQDHVCPPEAAYTLASALGSNTRLHIVPGGHANELVLREVLRAYSYAYLRNE